MFDDADIAAAVNGSAFAIFHNQGQACIAGSRLLLHEQIADEFLERFLELAGVDPARRPARPGDRDGAADLGDAPRPRAALRRGRPRGGRRDPHAAARRPTTRPWPRGCYVRPTVVRTDPSSRVCREEVFGPFVTVTTFRREDEALAIANDVEYGLGGGLWTRDLARAHRVARAIRSGMVWVNSYKRVNPGSPFGGVGTSGYGREMGFEAMHEYTEPKSVWVNVDAPIPPFYPRS